MRAADRKQLVDLFARPLNLEVADRVTVALAIKPLTAVGTRLERHCGA